MQEVFFRDRIALHHDEFRLVNNVGTGDFAGTPGVQFRFAPLQVMRLQREHAPLHEERRAPKFVRPEREVAECVIGAGAVEQRVHGRIGRLLQQFKIRRVHDRNVVNDILKTGGIFSQSFGRRSGPGERRIPGLRLRAFVPGQDNDKRDGGNKHNGEKDEIRRLASTDASCVCPVVHFPVHREPLDCREKGRIERRLLNGDCH